MIFLYICGFIADLADGDERGVSHLKIEKLDDRVSYIPATDNPLSANVVLIRGERNLWLYDVGMHPEIPELLRREAGGLKLRAVLSHFHPDHIGNLGNLEVTEVYQGKNTLGYTRRGTVVSEELFLADGEQKLRLFSLPSSHARGCLALEVNEKYCFLGDALYPGRKGGSPVFNVGLLKAQLDILQGVKARYFLESHREPFGQTREAVLCRLERLYAGRQSGQAYLRADV